ncbi:MAG TPA: addiction module protein [bacterium]|nr:addiction module protein [bacterium]
MKMSVEEIRERAKELPDIEKLALVDTLLSQLDLPDDTLDRIWLEEVQKRQQAHREGHLESISYEEVMEPYSRP